MDIYIYPKNLMLEHRTSCSINAHTTEAQIHRYTNNRKQHRGYDYYSKLRI